MNTSFDADTDVSMLMIFRDFDGMEMSAAFDTDVFAAQFRALANVDKYVVVGAPDGAQEMIDFLGKLMPVDTKTFDADDEAAAWAYLQQ